MIPKPKTKRKKGKRRPSMRYGQLDPSIQNSERRALTDGVGRILTIIETKKTSENMAAYLQRLANGDTPAVACAATNLGYATVYRWRRDDAEFAAAWKEAVECGVDLLEQEARRRAYTGVDRPVFQGGECVGHVREYSDTLAMFLLRGRRSTVFRDRVEHSGPDGGPIPHQLTNLPDLSKMSADELTGLYREAVAALTSGNGKP